jgi:hypothetical protein
MTRPDPRPGILPFAVSLVLLLVVAGSGTAAAEPVTVDIGVVFASNEGSVVDPALSALRAKLQSMFTYSSYRMLDRMKRPLEVGETGDFALPGGRNLRLSPVSAPAKKVRLAVQLTEGGRNLLTTTLGLSRGGMVVVGGPPYQSGVMILLISAE